MNTLAAVHDLNGDLTCWGTAREPARGLSARPHKRPAAQGRDGVPFGDQQGPLAYWGPSAAIQSAMEQLVAA